MILNRIFKSFQENLIMFYIYKHVMFSSAVKIVQIVSKITFALLFWIDVITIFLRALNLFTKK